MREQRNAKPFLRWAGSKQKLLSQILPHFPEKYGRYYEPFLGSGAIFFAIRPSRATLSDINFEIISTWKSIRDKPEYISNYLDGLKPNKELYYSLRENRSECYPERAAELLYLNKSCWNGLYRVNSKGKFNVPYGAPKSDFIVDHENISRCSKILSRRHISLLSVDFESAVARAKEGDLVFFDPPYVTRHNNNGFRDYNETLFSWDDQERLARCATRLVDKGVSVIVTNAAHEEVKSLYRNFRAERIFRTSTLASDATRRGVAEEALFVSV